jgi:DNA-binding Xre family transcriptional regulator
MLMVNLKALMERKGAIEGKRLTYKTVETATGIRALTLSRIATNHSYNLSRQDIEKLLIYFSCEPNDLFTLLEVKKKKK